MGSRVLANPTTEERLPDADARLLEQICSGDAQAGRSFVQEHYSAIYRYLLSLTGQAGLAEDLAQETFLQGWQHLDSFQGRASLRTWLHRIARNAFLQALRRQKTQALVETAVEPADPAAGDWTAQIELREAIDRLPLEQREVVLLHYLEGYSSTEIARIVQAPVGTVCYRLSRARERLRQALGEDDLTYLNEPLAPMRRWAWLPLDQIYALESRLMMRGVGRGVSGVRPDPSDPSDPTPDTPRPTPTRKEEPMERREFLRQAAVGAAGLVLAEPGKEVVDGRLTQKVTCAFKATALSDLCEQLRAESSVHVTAGPSVADEKVTLFCEKLPLREVMRQLSRPFGYSWLRSGTAGQYRYELTQDLRSQLLEEELRNRDRNAALLALDHEMERYRPLLSLSPDEALERAKTAPPEEKKLLDHLSGAGWGPIQIYFRLSAQEQAALRSGQELKFSQEPQPENLRFGVDPVPSRTPQSAVGTLPADIARGTLQARREARVAREPHPDGAGADHEGDRLRFLPAEEAGGVPPSAIPEARAAVSIQLEQTELGRFGFSGNSTVIIGGSANGSGTGPYAVGVSPAVSEPENAKMSARLAGDPALRPRVTIQPEPSCRQDPASASASGGSGEERAPAPGPKATSADVLEALHRATGLPIVADFYTRLYPLESVSMTERPLYEALNQLCDTMRLRWNKESSTSVGADSRSGGAWLQFRSLSFYNDRPKEVPNRLLSRWAAVRREHGSLTLVELIEIAGLPDAPQDAREMAEGAHLCWRLKEWDLACNPTLRPHLRWMASFTSGERQKLQQTPGLRFPELSLAQQQRFISLAIDSDPDAIDSLAEMETATMQVDYSLPGGFEWKAPEKREGPPEPLAPVRAATREGALAAARRIDPQADPAHIQPTRLSFTLFYRWGNAQANGHRRITTTRRGDTSVSAGRSKTTP